MKNSSELDRNRWASECFVVKLTNPMLYDRLQILSAEYSLEVERLVNIAIERLLADVEFVRNLRTGMKHLE